MNLPPYIQRNIPSDDIGLFEIMGKKGNPLFTFISNRMAQQFLQLWEQAMPCKEVIPFGMFVGGDVACIDQNHKLFIFLNYEPNELVWSQMPLDVFYNRIMEGDETVEDAAYL